MVNIAIGVAVVDDDGRLLVRHLYLFVDILKRINAVVSIDTSHSGDVVDSIANGSRHTAIGIDKAAEEVCSLSSRQEVNGGRRVAAVAVAVVIVAIDIIEHRGHEIISKLIDASYPDYQKLIPKNNNIKVTLNREELIRVTKLAALFARSVGGSIICEAKAPDTFSVKSIANEFGENASNIEVKVNESGRVNFNSRFILDALNSLESKEIEFEFSNHISPAILRNKKDHKYTHIVMPLNS